MAESQYLVELQHTNRALRLLSSVNQALMHAATETALIQHICEIAVEIGEYRLAWVGFAEHDAQRTVRPICHAGNAQGYLEQIHFSWADDEQPCDPAGMAIRTRQPAIQEDIGRVAACAPWREAALSRGFHSTIALPLEIGGAVIGALALYGDRAYAFSPAEVALLTELAGDLSYGISALRTRERQRRAEAEVRGSAQRLHALIEAAPYGAHEYELQPDGRLLFIGYNPAANRILGVDHASLLGLTIDEAFPPLRHTPIPEAYRRVARTGERYEDEQVTYAHGEIVGTYEISAFQTAPGRMAVFFRDITERRRAERALRASEEKFAKAFYTSPDSININRLEDGVYVEINHGFTQMTGFTRDDVIGRSSLAGGIDIWVHPEDRQQLLTALRTHGELLGMEAEFRRKDGQLLTGSMSAKLIELNGDPCVLTITRDITERKLAAQQLQESEEKYRFLFDTMAQGVVFQDADTRIIEANRAASHILGLTMGQLLGASSYDPRWALIHEDHVPFGPEDMPSNIALRTGKPVTDVVCGVYFPEEQDYHWIIISSVPRCRVGDAKPALTMTTFTDITARKQAEDALRASEERLSHIIRNSPDLFYILDRELRYIWAPKTVIDLTEDETLGKTDHDVFSPEEAERLDAINRRVMATGESVRYEKDMPRDTTMLHYENTALPWRDAEGRITGVVVYAHDITERKQAEEALRAREALLRAVVDNAPFEFWARDIDGRCIMENKALVDHWGDLLGQLPEDAHLSPEELAIWQENNRRASAGDVVQVEVEYTVADERRVFQNIVAPIYVDGRLHGIMGFNIDITARKRAEEAMQRESTFLASAIELLPFPIFILTPCYEILRQN
ncbi:MAG TPA: PAS domain S-box protein, partial [Armatimonadota bacterium]